MPRLRPPRPATAFGLGALLAATMFGGGVSAQTAPGSFPEIGTFDPPGGQGVLDPESGDAIEASPLIRKSAPTFGNPPASGAGKSGFDSTNARRRIQSGVEDRKERRQPLPPVVTTQARPVPALPPTPVLPPLQPADPVTTGSIAPPAAPARPPRPRPKPPEELDPYAPLGLRAGSFMLYPALELAAGYDSNPGRESQAQGSPLYVIAPELLARSDWERHELRAMLRGSYFGYPDAPELDRPYFNSVIDARLDATRDTRIELQNRLVVSEEMPGTPEFSGPIDEPTRYVSLGGTAGLFHRFNRLEIGGRVSLDRMKYDDSEAADGTIISNDDRSFTALGGELRGSYEVLPGVRPFVSVTADKRVHDEAIDSFGVARDSRALTPRIGTTFELSRQLTGDVSLGYITRSYEDPQLKDVKGVIADASLIWSATALTKAILTASSSVYESTDPDVSGVLARDLGLQVDHAFRQWLIGTLKFGYGHDDYVGTTRIDHRFTAAAGFTYKMNRNAQLNGELRRQQRNSNEPGEDYTANIVLLGVRLQH